MILEKTPSTSSTEKVRTLAFASKALGFVVLYTSFLLFLVNYYKFFTTGTSVKVGAFQFVVAMFATGMILLATIAEFIFRQTGSNKKMYWPKKPTIYELVPSKHLIFFSFSSSAIFLIEYFSIQNPIFPFLIVACISACVSGWIIMSGFISLLSMISGGRMGLSEEEMADVQPYLVKDETNLH